jgi:hypothetical protein
VVCLSRGVSGLGGWGGELGWRGRRAKRPQNKSRQLRRGRGPALVFRGLDRDLEQAAVDGDDAEAYLADADSSVLADPKTAQELLARRRFAVPAVAASIDGDEIELDPGDEDPRRLLIVAEHPHYRAVLEDPFSEQLVDGINPRLHVTMHQIIANQIWDDTPLEVWQAAQRLRAAGHDRHDILHALAYELSQELHPVLTGQHAPDPDMTAYRDRLRAL